MNRKWFSIAALLIAAVVLLNLSSCARSQELVGITVTPQGSTITLGQVGEQVSTQFTALGTYIHPPETKDVTSKAVWTTNSPSIIALDPNQPGLVTTTGQGCGANLGVTASIYSNPSNPPAGSVIVGAATMNVIFTGSVSCP
jgi:hypothetical protein